MQRWRGYEAAPGGWGRSVVTIGVFDGVHRGHQATIGHAVARARELGVAVGRGDLRPAPGRGGPPRFAPGGAHRAGPQGRADRGARRRRALRGARSRRSSPGCRPRRSCTTCWSSTCTPRWSWSGRTSGSGTRPPATWRCWSGSAGPSASPSRARRWSPTGGTVFSSTYIRSCVDAGDVAAAARRAGPAAPGRGRGGPRRPARPGAGLPHRQPALPPVRGGARRRRLRGLAGRAAAGDREPAAGGGLDRHQPDLLRPGAPGRGVRAGLLRRPVRRAAGPGLRGRPARAAPLRRRSSR